MGFSPAVGRFIERDPIGYQDGMNSYEFVKDNPVVLTDPSGTKSIADVFDHADDDPMARIGEQGAGLLWAWGHLGGYDRFMTELFVKTQNQILAELAKGACPCIDDAEKQWLMNTVKDFIRPLSESMYQRGNGDKIANAGWNQYFKDLDNNAFENVRVPVAGLGRLFNVPDMFASARAMALNHINNDLKAALQKNGRGNTATWKCIGNVVDKASHLAIDQLSRDGMDIMGWWDSAWDVSQIRDQMRTTVP